MAQMGRKGQVKYLCLCLLFPALMSADEGQFLSWNGSLKLAREQNPLFQSSKENWKSSQAAYKATANEVLPQVNLSSPISSLPINDIIFCFTISPSFLGFRKPEFSEMVFFFHPSELFGLIRMRVMNVL